jgi:hypothetical protein
MAAIFRDLPPGHPDGAQALGTANSALSAATRAYAQALHAWNDFLLNRRGGDGDDGS